MAPLLNEDAKNRIPGQYIVVFKKGTSRAAVRAAQDTARNLGGIVRHTYTSALNGFSVSKLPDSALPALRAIPSVDYIQADQKFSINATVNQGINPATDNVGLDRITQRVLPMDGFYNYDGTGAGVHVFVIDTGIRETHAEFGTPSRASWFYDALFDPVIGGNVDCNGHGTNVAGIIGAATYGVAHQVTLHAVRVLGCDGSGDGADVVAGVDQVKAWKMANPMEPAVANMSLQSGPYPALDTAVNNSIAAGVTFVVAAGNGLADGTGAVDACNVSPARVPNAITVGNANLDDSQWTGPYPSNFGPCLDLYAPGVNIRSTGNASDTATSVYTGTSQAAPHVAGIAARYLSSFPTLTPAQVWAHIDLIANVSPGTAGWPGITSLGAGSPNKLLVWMALNDAFDDGDPHIKTVSGIHYDFQSAGEFVALRDANGLEIQTRQTPIPTAPPIANAYTGLAVCVSLNTAVAARVNKHRVTYQPNIKGVPDPSGLQLRVDGVLTTLGAGGRSLGRGGRVIKSAVGNGIEIDFPDGTALIATPNWWAAQSKWYLNISVFRTTASEGIMGAIAPGSWLPALPDRTSLGPKPTGLSDRYTDLYVKFADAWRITDKTSLFYYAAGTSTKTFTFEKWPQESPPCVIPGGPPAVKPLDLETAQKACRQVLDKNRNSNCVFDVRFMGDTSVARAYLLSQQIEAASTRTTVKGSKTPALLGESVTFTATVTRGASGGKDVPTGTVQFTLDGSKVGEQVKLDARGRATWKASRLRIGDHLVGANYIPAKDSVLLASTSLDEPHSVIGREATK